MRIKKRKKTNRLTNPMKMGSQPKKRIKSRRLEHRRRLERRRRKKRILIIQTNSKAFPFKLKVAK